METMYHVHLNCKVKTQVKVLRLFQIIHNFFALLRHWIANTTEAHQVAFLGPFQSPS